MSLLEAIHDLIQHLSASLHIECRVDVQESESEGRHTMAVTLSTSDHAEFLIGKNGEHLQALEHLLRLLAARQGQGEVLVTLDINDYKKLKGERATLVAQEALHRVRATGKPEALPPMSSYERRIVHTELMGQPDVITESIGEGSQRRVVIKPS